MFVASIFLLKMGRVYVQRIEIWHSEESFLLLKDILAVSFLYVGTITTLSHLRF